MKASPDILLLADHLTADRLRPYDAAGLDVRHEPFEALEQLARRTYKVVLLAARQEGYPRLVKAVRRLQPSARLFGLCSPTDEPEIRDANGGDLLEDYFIIPPSQRDWRRILDAAQSGSAGADIPAARNHLPVPQLGELISSTQSLEDLARCVARQAAAVCGVKVAWSRLNEPRAGLQQLLVLDDDPPRILWAAEPIEPDEHASQWLSSLRGLLPSLAASARRTSLLRKMISTDELTGAFSRRYFLHFARQLLERAAKNRFRVTLLLYDIDNFKHYNDQFGHAAGDEILRETAVLMKQITRSHDIIARIGGDEFAVLFWDAGPTRLPNSQPPQSAYALADRFRKAVSTHQYKLLGPTASGTLGISGGLATFPWDGHSVEQLLDRADQALRKAKQAGKNNILIAGEGGWKD